MMIRIPPQLDGHHDLVEILIDNFGAMAERY